MDKIGIFGGSFNPIHLGHLIPVYEVLIEKELDKVIYMPNYYSPHKSKIKNVSDEDRLEIIRKTISSYPFFELDEYEIKRKRPVHTIETLEYLKNKYSHNKLYLIIGMDQYNVFHTWKDYIRIIDLTELIVMKRTVENNQEKMKIPAHFVMTSRIDISSSKIRNWIINNKPFELLMNYEAARLIKNKKLYLEDV